MTDLHPDLDAYLDGDLSDADARAVDTHVASCAACADELAIAQRLTAELASLRDETCPPDLVAGAIASATRQAPDRAPARSAASRFARLNRWVIACAVLVVAAIGLSRLVPDRQLDTAPTPASELAEARPNAAPAPVTQVPSAEATPQPQFDPPTAERATQASPQPSSPSTAARRETRPSPAPSTPTLQSGPDPDPSSAAPGAAEIERAQADLLLALSLVADAQSHAQSSVSNQLERAADALHDTPIF